MSLLVVEGMKKTLTLEVVSDSKLNVVSNLSKFVLMKSEIGKTYGKQEKK